MNKAPPHTVHPHNSTMTEQHKATPDMWASIRQAAQPRELAPGIFAGESTTTLATGLIELRARVEALEAAQRVHAEATRPPHQDKLDRLIALDRDDESPAGSLVERVGNAINNAPSGRYEDRDTQARAAIREVAARLKAKHHSDHVVHTAWEAAKWLEQEATR